MYTKIKNEAKLTISGGIKKQLQNANRRIDEHNRKRGTLKYRGLQRLWLETQIVALGELMSYMDMLGFWEADEGQSTLNGWLHALLPSVYPVPVDNLPVDDPKHHLNYEADSQKLFGKLLAAMGTPENCKHFMAVQAKGECPMKKADGTDVWGYVRGFQITGKDGHRYRVPTLQIREDVLTAAKLLGKEDVPCDVYKLVKIHPFTPELISEISRYDVVLFAEECVACGGIGEHLETALQKAGWQGTYIHRGVEDVRLPHATVPQIKQSTGLDAEHLAQAIRTWKGAES